MEEIADKNHRSKGEVIVIKNEDYSITGQSKARMEKKEELAPSPTVPELLQKVAELEQKDSDNSKNINGLEKTVINLSTTLGVERQKNFELNEKYEDELRQSTVATERVEFLEGMIETELMPIDYSIRRPETVEGRSFPNKMMGHQQQGSRKRHRSSASNGDEDVPPRKRPVSSLIHPLRHYQEPKNGWCKDERTIDKRTKEIDKAKEKPVYADYLKMVPLHSRIKGVHPTTPNKLINHSRRSWDAQMKQWKRSLYAWAGDEHSESTNVLPAKAIDKTEQP
ncbi:hypothetical protein PMAYCL1PPCAC_20708 [Pristionchus mayeri]|uniref:Histone RNA hairpin-binding protein RNA-binding domain-containing protein n=1 Tax=Pristionchus mayeri TaxID=1317129 RepID=A0AAN5CTM8_9BILA|nr:hypothetical protein PMAYCL1PPCAC_20708 [Pristionchus mayeri]